MARSESQGDVAFANAVTTIIVVVAIVAIIITVWLAVRTANALANAFALRPRSRLLWGLLAASLICVGLALITQAEFWLVAAVVILLVLVAGARMVVVAAEPLYRDPERHEFLDDVMNDWWPEVPNRGWAELE